jgi:hypothetical protein
MVVHTSVLVLMTAVVAVVALMPQGPTQVIYTRQHGLPKVATAEQAVTHPRLEGNRQERLTTLAVAVEAVTVSMGALVVLAEEAMVLSVVAQAVLALLTLAVGAAVPLMVMADQAAPALF